MSIEVTSLKSRDDAVPSRSLDEIAAEFREASKSLGRAIREREEGVQNLQRAEKDAQRRLDIIRHELHMAVLGLTQEEMQDAWSRGEVISL